MEKIIRTYNTVEKVMSKNTRMGMIMAFSGFFTTLVMGFLIYNVSKNNMMAVDKDGDIVSLMRTSEDNLMKVEADNHIRLFYDRFFTYDKSTYQKQTELGLHLTGPSGRALYETSVAKNWYNKVVNNDLEVESSVLGDIDLFMVGGVLAFEAKGLQKIKRGGIVEYRKLDIKGIIYQNDDGRIRTLNPHGMKIDDIVITDNSKMEDGYKENL